MPDPEAGTWRRLDLPWIDTRIDEYVVDSWEVRPGQQVHIGDAICVVRSGDLATRSERQGNKAKVGWLERRRVRRHTEAPVAIKFRARVLAGESGYLGHVLAEVGAAVRRDGPVALMSDAPAPGAPPDAADLLRFRAEAETISRDEAS